MPRSARKSLTGGRQSVSAVGLTAGHSSAVNAGLILAKMCQNSGQQHNKSNTNSVTTPQTVSSVSGVQSSAKTPSILHSKTTPQSQQPVLSFIADDTSSSQYTSLANSSPTSMSRNNAFASLVGAATNQFNQYNMDSLQTIPIKRRKQDPKTGKGLRHFSMK
ncbi:unnamed protein product, partial [Medioppia subpectinata]